ncbi:hypothetical protein MMC28_009645 [Mycoblastus sanguinarius]|nr:hypothetical protein [Mycoblastus sanguinarius]
MPSRPTSIESSCTEVTDPMHISKRSIYDLESNIRPPNSSQDVALRVEIKDSTTKPLTSHSHSHKPTTTPPKVHATTNQPPPTPDTTPIKSTKRAHSTTLPPETPTHTSPLTHKRRLTPTHHFSPSQSPCRRLMRSTPTPKFSILYTPPPPKEVSISGMELKRAAESILRQVDWSEVEEDVASNRCGGTYRRIIRNVLQERIDELVEREEATMK